jgi:hypothetical protein
MNYLFVNEMKLLPLVPIISLRSAACWPNQDSRL